MEVPTAASLHDVYSEDAIPQQKKRWENLLAKFESQYGRKADFVSRSPGRVNIIGEHIDYSLYEVLPMAVTADVLQAISIQPQSDSSRIRVSNVNTEKFPTREFEIPAEGEVPIDAESHEWTNYFKAGLRGASELLQKKKSQSGHFRSVGMDVLVDGTVPSGGGLSSSAAFVCASALAVMRANGEETVDKKELVELAIVSERAVGVNSGGMDQSASVFAQRGSALYVSFKPSLNAKAILFPPLKPAMTFVIAQSFVAADKHVTAPINYNLRVVECSMAAAFLHRIFGLKRALPSDSGPLGISLRGFHDVYFEEKEGVEDNTKASVEDFIKQLEKLIDITEDYLTQEDGYTREQIAEILGVSVDELNQRFTSRFPVRAERFLLRQRALHVFNEAIRVNKFMSLLSSPPPQEGDGGSSEPLLQQLGTLMNETQDSCRDLYDCSCPELDELCRLARNAGSYGSRLTGAGWGGCTVHLVPRDKVEAIKKAWEERYYRKKWPDISEEKLREAVVVSEPGSGSMVFRVVGEEVV